MPANAADATARRGRAAHLSWVGRTVQEVMVSISTLQFRSQVAIACVLAVACGPSAGARPERVANGLVLAFTSAPTVPAIQASTQWSASTGVGSALPTDTGRGVDVGARNVAALGGSRGLWRAYARVVDTVRAITRVPLRLPLTGWGDGYDDSTRVTVSDVTPDRYELILGNSPAEDCDGGTWCRIGTVTGERRHGPTPLPHGRAVTVRGRYRGVFTDATCGANCSDSKVTWDDGPYRYSVGLKAGRLDRVQRMAESVAPFS